MKISRSSVLWDHKRLLPTEPAYFRFGIWLTWKERQSFNRVALLDFPNVVGQNGSNSDSEMSHVRRVVMLKRIISQWLCYCSSCFQYMFTRMLLAGSLLCNLVSSFWIWSLHQSRTGTCTNAQTATEATEYIFTFITAEYWNFSQFMVIK